MKKLIIALILSMPMATAQALFIEAELTGFQSSDVRLNGGAPAGGIGTFQLATDVTGTAADFLGGTFLAACLEPDEFVTVGDSYQFEFVDLRDAPTSVIGGMGLAHELMVERAMTGLGWDSIGDVVAAGSVGVSALGMVLYEAAFETEPVFDWAAGSAQLTGSGSAMSGAVSAHVTSTLTPTVEAYGLRNVAAVPGTRSLFTGQDFVVLQQADGEVSAPGAGLLMTLGLGLLGMTRLTRGKS